MSTFYIGIGGVARSGKDSFARSLKKVLKDRHPNSSILIESLATPLKLDCQSFIKERLNLDVFTNDSLEKSLFREMLVWYGKVKRQQSQGAYWTNLLDQKVLKANPDFCIIPDIRYQQYEKDEVAWLRSKTKNYFIHLQRRLPSGEFHPPANMDEKINDNIIRNFANKSLIIETYPEEIFTNEILKLAEASIKDIL